MLSILRWLFCSAVVDSLFIVSVITCVFMFGPCFVMQCFMSILVLKSSYRGIDSWLFYCNCIFAVRWMLGFCVSSSGCLGLVCVCGISGVTHLLLLHMLKSLL